MFAVWLLVFREVLEAAMILGILAASTRGLPGRWRGLGSGIAAGLLGACVLAWGAGALSSSLDGMGQEWFNAAVLLLATAMIGWHVIFMSRHGRTLAREASDDAVAVAQGRRDLGALMLVAMIAVLREGSETVLFGYGLFASGTRPAALLSGGALGVLTGIITGVALYAGLLRIPLRHFFSATNGLLSLMAAGLAAEAVNYLAQANVLTAWTTPLWNSSALLPEEGWLGRALHVLVGYTDQPSAMQVLLYLGTLVVFASGAWWADRSSPRTSPASAQPQGPASEPAG